MNALDRFHIDIFKLSNSTHTYEFEFNDKFFAEIENSIVEKGAGNIHITLEKNESFIKMTIKITGKIELTCDRSLDLFDFPLNVDKEIIFKYGEEEIELDDNIVMITRDTQRLNLAQYIYEFIGLEIPMKKLHPRFDNESEEDEMVYTDEVKDNEDDSETTDPRWEALKKLK
ncbi:YceD family protein [Fulvivirga lutea]|uniref:DUF177 domain-containing protein n=1 Tax=Fulvivirga lutea TaxID=2810512 RepID=A0A975A0Z6_9BACT|nr:DUF177 domain-containing protein [Fulvivirga lutea]QSE96987.1 DUF177 domain-containing protein [Fulvivirga lutea]